MDVGGLDRATAAQLARDREIQCAGQLGAALIGGALAVVLAEDCSWWRIALVVLTLLLAVFGLVGARSLVIDVRPARQVPPAPG